MDLAKYRKPWELEEHWLLRKSFIETYLDKYPINKLLCYSQLFVNIETLGVSYDKECMDLIQELSSKIDYIKEYRSKRKKAIENSYAKFKNIEAKNNFLHKKPRYDSPAQSSYYNSNHYQHQSFHQPYHQPNCQPYQNRQSFNSNYYQQPNFNYRGNSSIQTRYNNFQKF